MNRICGRADIEKVIIDSLSEIGMIVLLPENGDIDLIEEGLESLEFINLILKMEEKLSIAIPDQFLNLDVFRSLKCLTCLLEQIVIDNN